MGNAYELESYLVGFFEKEIRCLVCGKENEHVDVKDLFTKLQIYQDVIDFEELSPSEKEDSRKEKIEALDPFSLCQQCCESGSEKAKQL